MISTPNENGASKLDLNPLAPASMPNKLRALIWKNFLIKSRTPLSTLFELILPVLFMLILVWLNSVFDATIEPANLQNDSLISMDDRQTWSMLIQATAGNNQSLAFAPASGLALTLANDLKTRLPSLAESIVMFESETELENHVTSANYPSLEHPAVYAAVVVDSEAPNFRYSLRFNSSSGAVPRYQSNNYVNEISRRASPEQTRTYFRGGFIALQNYIENAIVELGSSASPLALQFQYFPTPEFYQDTFAMIAGALIPQLIAFGYTYSVIRISTTLMEEKEKRIREGLKTIGVSEFVLMMSWAIFYIMFFAIQSLLISLTTRSMYQFIGIEVIFFLFFLFGMALFSFAYMLTAFFTRQRVAGTFTALAFLVSAFVYYAVESDTTSEAEKTWSCLLAPTCSCHSAYILTQFNSSGLGMTFLNLNQRMLRFRVQTGLLMLSLDTVLYALLGAYFSKVLPSTFGVREPFYFFLMPSFWKPPTFEADEDVNDVVVREVGDESSKAFEPIPPGSLGKALVSIRNLRKSFGHGESQTVAVQSLSLDLYADQVFCLLGHNGAGKTTTISILTGFYMPTSGDAHIVGHSIRTDMGAIRTQHLGMCPQHDALYDSLTVKEHLMIYGRAKGLSGDRLTSQVDELIKDVGLEEKVNARSQTLSGGQKRKLSIALALCGGSKVIFLDEPTSGMDPYARRSTWELIKRAKKGRCIVLTTHFLDEADYLGDRIGIMAHGVLQCVGSSLFLKSLFGVGYTMTCSRNKSVSDKDEALALLATVKEHVPNAEILSDAAGEIAFRLPFKSSGKFPNLFETLDENLDKFSVRSYGISVTTLEEVFLRVGESASLIKQSSQNLVKELSDGRRNSQSHQAPQAIGTGHVSAEILETDSLKLFSMHIVALLKKRWQSSKRDTKVWLWQIFYPTLLLVGGLTLVKFTIDFEFVSVPISSSAQFGSTLSVPAAFNPQNHTVDSAGFSLLKNHLLEGQSLADISGLATSRSEVANQLLKTIFTEKPRYGAFFLDKVRVGPTTLDQYTIFFNTTAYHSMPLFLNALNNARLRSQAGKSSQTITLSNSILPRTASEIVSTSSATTGLIISIAFAFIPASFVAFIVRERATKVLHLQIISGVSTTAYWLSSFIWDFLNFLLPSLICLILLLIFDIETLIGENIGGTIALMLLFGTSCPAFTYLLSFLFKDPAIAQNTLMLINVLSGTVLLIVSIIMGVIESTQEANDILVYFYRLIPMFSFASGIVALMGRETLAEPKGVWDMEIVGAPALTMGLCSLAYFGGTMLVELMLRHSHLLFTELPRKIFPGFRLYENLKDADEKIDEDVQAEMMRIKSGAAKDEMIRVEGLRKVFPTDPPKVANRDIWFSIPQGECFGYLGVNGAGKTTCLRILSGDEQPTRGCAYLGGLNILTEQSKVRHLIGYCPQFDALIGTMTGREHLELYAAIKGVPQSQMQTTVQPMIEELGLGQYADKAAGGYSGGNRRKLSVGISLVGNPPVVFLDEPSTGVDPASRRSMWNLISRTMAGRSVILTTHSMEECEALCSRIAIQVSGSLQCIGTAAHLKHRFGKGYQIDINGTEELKLQVENFVHSSFSGVTLLEKHNARFKFRINKDKSLAETFRIIEQGRTENGIVEYSISETSLEQIFIQFAQHQIEESAPAPGVIVPH